MSTVLLVVGILVGTLAMIVLTALLRGAVSYLNARWHALESSRRREPPSVRNRTVGPWLHTSPLSVLALACLRYPTNGYWPWAVSALYVIWKTPHSPLSG